MSKCRYCGHMAESLLQLCINSRDMEDRAIYGNDRCYEALKLQGGGEKGMRYVDLNREHDRKRRELSPSPAPAGSAG